MSNNQQQTIVIVCVAVPYFCSFLFLNHHRWKLFKCHTTLYSCSENFYYPSKLVDTLSSIFAHHSHCNKKCCGFKLACANLTWWPQLSHWFTLYSWPQHLANHKLILVRWVPVWLKAATDTLWKTVFVSFILAQCRLLSFSRLGNIEIGNRLRLCNWFVFNCSKKFFCLVFCQLFLHIYQIIGGIDTKQFLQKINKKQQAQKDAVSHNKCDRA